MRHRRQGFTLVELLVAMALTLFVMVILSQAFVTGLETFRQLKGLGDMQRGLRAATLRLQDDLRADHFEAGRKLSDPTFWTPPLYSALPYQLPAQGFFLITQSVSPPAAPAWEGNDLDGLPSYDAQTQVLRFTLRRRGNQQEGFFSANVPAGSPLLTVSTALGNLPADARWQDPTPYGNSLTYNSAWAEVAYFLQKTGTTVEPNNRASAQGTALYALYRVQKVLASDTSAINAANLPGDPATVDAYAEMSCEALPNSSGATVLFFNSPASLVSSVRTNNYSIAQTAGTGVAPLLSNVVSFQVQYMRGGENFFRAADPAGNALVYDTGNPAGIIGGPYTLSALQITLRVWDAVTQQSRQVSFVQDM
jgi:prepilin-type N-terminal cleavage/methylation domain-containing protein